jgi:uncharacterized protein (DUF2236 family)
VNRHRDNGFFGPGSATWKVWSYPTSPVLGFLRAVVVEELDPFLVASVDHSGQVKQRTRLRYDRTLQYFATVMFADAESVLASAETLVKIHSRSVGPEPVTGGTFDANDPDSQLWIHLTAWHSILYTYEMFGPGRLPVEAEREYWAQCATAAHFQTIDPNRVPRTRAGIAEYFEEYRPRLVGSPVAQDMMNFLLRAVPRVLEGGALPAPFHGPVSLSVRKAVVATMPRWMRELAGIKQSRAADVAVTAQMRPVIRALAASPALQLAIIRRLSPRTAEVAEPVLRGTPAAEDRTWTPAEAYAHFGRVTPPQQYAQIVAARVAGAGPGAYGRHHSESVMDFSVGDE